MTSSSRLPEPVEERPVDEAVALVAVDVGDRQAERVQLALRQRQQRLPLDGFADRLCVGRSRRVSERGRAMARCSGRTGHAGSDSGLADRRSPWPSKSSIVTYKQGSRPVRECASRDAAGKRAPSAPRHCAVDGRRAATIRGTNNRAGRHRRRPRPRSGRQSPTPVPTPPDVADAMPHSRRIRCPALSRSPPACWRCCACCSLPARGRRRRRPSRRRSAGVPIDFILFGADAARRRAVPPPHAARSR